MSLRSWLRDVLDDEPRYADRSDGFMVSNLDLPQTPITEFTRNSSSWDALFGAAGIAGLPVVTEQTAITLSVVYGCQNLIAGAVSALSSPIYRLLADGERDQLYGDPLWWVLNEQFLPRWNAANGWEYLIQSLLMHGDGIGIIHRKGGLQLGTIDGIEPVHPLSVNVIPTPDRKRLIYAIARENGGLEVYDQDDILHFAGFGFNGCRGLSPLRNHLRMTGSVGLATQEYAGRFFANGARPDILLTSDQELNREQANLIRELWEEQYGGLANSHRPAVLGLGTKAAPLSLPLQEAQLLESRRFSVEEICRIYGVPPYMVGHLEKTTSFGKGVEHMGIAFVRFTLRQHLTKIEKEINRKFFRNAGKFIEFDTFELERADMKSLFEAFRIALGRAGEPGFMTAEEVRNKLNLKRKPQYGKLASGEGTPAPAPPKDPNAPDPDTPEDEEDDESQEAA